MIATGGEKQEPAPESVDARLLRILGSLFPAEVALARLTLDVRDIEHRLAGCDLRALFAQAGSRLASIEARLTALENKRP